MSDFQDGATAPSLVVTGGPLDGRTLALERGATQALGSGPDCALRLELANVEARHAQVVWNERGVLLSDGGSATGTYVNGEKIGADHALQDGDRVFLGPPGSKQSAKLLARVPASAPGAGEEDALPIEGSAVGSDSDALVLDEGGGEPLVLADEAPPEPPIPPPVPEAAPPRPPAPAAAPVAKPEPPKTEAPKPAEPRKPHRPEYTSDMPSFPTDRTRDGVSVPAEGAPPPPAPAARAAPRPARRGAVVPRAALLGGAAALLTVGGFFAYRSFTKPPPVLLSLAPQKTEVGQTVSLGGSGFEPAAAGNVVRIGDQTGQVTSASDAQITVTIPSALKVPSGSTDVSVHVEARGSKSNALFLKVTAPPKIAALEPDVAMPGDEIVAKGQNLAGEGASVLVGLQNAQILESTASAMRFRVPEMPPGTGRSVPVVAQVGGEAGRPATLLLGRLPLVLELAPARGTAGTRVTLKGRGFDPNPRGNAVSFGGRPAAVVAATPMELVVVAPGVGLDAQATVPVTVTALGRVSAGDVAFALARPTAATFVPRFFAEPVTEHPDHDHAFVSTELGPLLLLSGKAEAPSTVERAERLAAALNGAFESAVGGAAAAFELRPQPPAVAVAGAANVLVAATPADAAGYDEPWEPSPRGDRAAKPRRSTPHTVAAFWAALLQDHMLLFAGRQRPFKVLEMSSRGRVLAEIYGEASRRGGSGGVPLGVVNPLAASRARALREMALLLPGEGATRAAGAVEGRWDGTMEEGDSGPRPIEVRLKLDAAGKLVGSVTTHAGRLAMDQPLREAAYDKQTLRFVLILGGSQKHFLGAVQGATIAGTIHASADGKSPVGRFTLRFVE